MEYVIIGKEKNDEYEEIDVFDNKEEAEAIKNEYQLAFGNNWTLEIIRRRE